ncbi:hypothetical protein PC116_g10667 [Phytophthora cactorum]|nr:hypothetical protein PC116_g10667 [Phytophthora cactorum]
MALWERIHKFPIPQPKIAKWLADFNKKRGNRLSHAGADWKKILVIFILTMQDCWCNLDLRLDPFFAHLPKHHDKVIWFPGVASRRANLADPTLHRSEPATLMEALGECNTADPWRNHFRDTPVQHPAHHIPRLPGGLGSLPESFNLASKSQIW